MRVGELVGLDDGSLGCVCSPQVVEEEVDAEGLRGLSVGINV